MTICPRCEKEKPDVEINLKKLSCRSCLKKEYNRLYRIKQKEKKEEKEGIKAERSVYFKKWYQRKGRYKKRKKNLQKRDERLYELYLQRKSRHWSVEAIAKMFQIKRWKAYEIIRKEKNKH